MSFFEDLPEPDEAPQQRYVEPEWRRIPREYVPVGLPLEELVHASEQAALLVSGVSVYPTGLTFTVTVTRHPEVDDPSSVPMHQSFFGGSPNGPRLVVRVGLLHDDGTRATWPDFGREGRGGPPAACLSSRGGGGSDESSSSELFAWPIPAAGDLTLLFQWKAQGLDEARVVIPGDDLRAAAASAAPIWPGARVPEPPTDDEGGLFF